MKEVLKNDDELWEKIALASGVWKVGENIPEINFDFYVDELSESNVYLSNDGIKKQIFSGLELNPERKAVHYFYYIKIPKKESFGEN